MHRNSLFAKIVFSICCIVTLVSCTNPIKKEASNTNGTIWAQNIRSHTDIIKPPDWSEEDWKTTVTSVQNKQIITTLFNAVLSGKHKALSVIDDSTQLNIEEVKAIIENKTKGSAPEDIIDVLRTRETWYFDSTTFSLTSKISAICPCKKHYDEMGSLQGYEPFFWIELGTGR